MKCSFEEYINIRALLESTSNVGIISFSRMNPVTIGHLKLMSKMVELGRKYKATPMLYLSHTQDKKKNPLSYEDKYKFVKACAPSGLSVINSSAKTIFDVAKEVAKMGVEHLILVAGADRVNEFSRLNKYKDEIGITEFSVVSAGDRDPDAEGVTGMSATKLRECAKNDDYENFKKGAGTHKNEALTKEMFKKVRAGLGL